MLSTVWKDGNSPAFSEQIRPFFIIQAIIVAEPMDAAASQLIDDVAGDTSADADAGVGEVGELPARRAHMVVIGQ